MLFPNNLADCITSMLARNPNPSCTEFEGGTYLGTLHGNLPHGVGLLFFRNDGVHASIFFFGGFFYGEEEGEGLTFFPSDGTFHYGIYSRGRRIENVSLPRSEIVNKIGALACVMCSFLVDLNDDLSIERDTVEQVNSALFSARERIDALSR